MSCGYRLHEGRFQLGAAGPRGLFIPQVREMQPAGHWEDELKHKVPSSSSPGLLKRALSGWLLDRKWVAYT